MWQGSQVRVDVAMHFVGAVVHLGGLVRPDVLTDQGVQVQTLRLSTALCILHHVQQKLALFLGHWPRVRPNCLACKQRPTPLLYRWKGIHCFFNVMSFFFLRFILLWCTSGAWWLCGCVRDLCGLPRVQAPGLARLCGILWVLQLSNHLGTRSPGVAFRKSLFLLYSSSIVISVSFLNLL